MSKLQVLEVYSAIDACAYDLGTMTRSPFAPEEEGLSVRECILNRLHTRAIGLEKVAHTC